MIVRLTGDGLRGLLDRLFVPCEPDAWLPCAGEPPRRVAGRLHPAGLGGTWGPLEVSLLFWPGPAGPLGAALAEVQLPASPVLASELQAEACRHGARLARGGEFSLRGYLAGKLDLLQAEAVLSLIEARTPEELTRALDRMAGGVGRAVTAVREDLLDLVADIEATIDFSDDLTPDAVPVPGLPTIELARRIQAAIDRLDAVDCRLADRDAATMESLPRVVLIGPPNIGKSSLFNSILGREAAVVADELGTTRDWVGGVLEDELGQPVCLLVDVAGLPEVGAGQPGPDAIAAAAADIALREMHRAAVVIACQDAVTGSVGSQSAAPRSAAGRIDVVTRSDRLAGAETPGAAACAPGRPIRTSALEGSGVDELRNRVLATIRALPPGSTPATIRLRSGIEAARRSLAVMLSEPGESGRLPPDEAFVAVVLREAIDALGEVTGAVIGMDIVDRVFSRHCIGK